MSGYVVGPTLPPNERPWPICWEQDPRIDDGHRHEWETVLLLPGPERTYGDEVVRCSTCHAPRCGNVPEPDPCMRRRHHRACHRLLSGRREHLGDLAAMCGCGQP